MLQCKNLINQINRKREEDQKKEYILKELNSI